MRLATAKKAGFSPRAIRAKRELPRQTIGYMKQKSSFLVAAFSLCAFISGNMLGQHGWYAFWKAALGQYDDSLIVYSGTVTPVALVPDYTKWSQYGGNGEEHTFRQVPKDLLIPLPAYDSRMEKKHFDDAPEGDVFSIGHMGSYETGAEGDGSHIGVDIRVPVGTPIRAIANGIVTSVRDDVGGFGKLIVIRHPHMPDPDNPLYETVLYSNYAHLSAQYVSEGDVVTKGQEIGLSGKTGFATGPHLHFQIDRDEAPWHPYWAFSWSEATQAGLTSTQAINKGLHQERGYEYTVNPILYVQENYPAAKYEGTAVAKRGSSSSKTIARASSSARSRAPRKTLAQARQERLDRRLAARATIVAKAAPVRSAGSSSVPSSSSSSPQPVIVQSENVATGGDAAPASSAPVLVVPETSGSVASIGIQHDGVFEGRDWEIVRVTLLDENGGRASESLLTKDLYMRTAYGEAEFDPPVLSALDFVNGVAEVKMLPRGRRTVVILIEPYKAQSKPMEYAGR